MCLFWQRAEENTRCLFKPSLYCFLKTESPDEPKTFCILASLGSQQALVVFLSPSSFSRRNIGTYMVIHSFEVHVGDLNSDTYGCIANTAAS